MENLSNIEIIPRDKAKALTGHNCRIIVDGKEIKGVRKASFEVSPQSIGKVTLEMVGNISVKGKTVVEQVENPEIDPNAIREFQKLYGVSVEKEGRVVQQQFLVGWNNCKNKLGLNPKESINPYVRAGFDSRQEWEKRNM